MANDANLKEFRRQRLACAYFFIAPALVYGILTSRLPAFKLLLNANDSEIGVLLLCLGLSVLFGLFVCSLVIDRLGVKNIIGATVILIAINISLASLAINLWQMAIFLIFAGVAVGFCDVAVNAQGICIEQRYHNYCLGNLHAWSSLGGVAGSLTGSFFAWLEFSPFLNMVIVLAIFIVFWPLAFRRMDAWSTSGDNKARKRLNWRGVAFIVWWCGILSLIVHIAEGSAAEWGSLLLHSVKGATTQMSALVFGCFTGAMVIGRFGTDIIRKYLSDVTLSFWGSLIGGAGIAIALLSPWPVLCLAGYAIMGAGLAPVVPILFSRAGASSSVTPGQASGIVSVFSYAGLLAIPPFIGMLGHAVGLVSALWIIVGLCVLLTFGSLWLGGTKTGTAS